MASTVAQRYVDKEGLEIYRLVHHNSRVLTATEKNCSKVEGENLAVLFGIKSNKMYLYGIPFEVVVDHKLLVPLHTGRPSPVRVDRHHAKLLSFNFTVIY